MGIVFISYSHEDAKTADEIATVLDRLAIKYFRDVKDINWGDSITSRVRDGLGTCRALLVIVSPASLKSEWVPFEIGHAMALRKTILPFLVHPSLDVPPYIRDLNYVKSIEAAREHFATRFAQDIEEVTEPTQVASSGQPELAEKQEDYLLEISRPRNEGCIHGGIDEETGRDAAFHQEALRLFQDRDLMRCSGGSYKLAPRGWRYADQLWALRVLDALDPSGFIRDGDIAEAVGLTDGQAELDEVRRHLDGLENRGFVSVVRTRGAWSAQIRNEGITHRKHRLLEL